jgi:hypothetical protein
MQYYIKIEVNIKHLKVLNGGGGISFPNVRNLFHTEKISLHSYV